MKKKLNLMLCLAALVSILAAGAGTAYAYFTSYALTDAAYPVALGDKTRITETFSAWTKHVRITADDDSGPVYIRAKALHSDAYGVEYSDPDGKWDYNSSDGFWYYKDILYAGQTSSELTVRIAGVPDDIDDPLAFGVAVVYEHTPVRYREDGTQYADWGQKISYESGKEGSK